MSNLENGFISVVVTDALIDICEALHHLSANEPDSDYYMSNACERLLFLMHTLDIPLFDARAKRNEK